MPLHLRVGEKFIGPGKVEDVEIGEVDPLRIHVVSGVSHGPKLFIVAGIHGDEPLAVEIASELRRSIDPRHVHGVAMIVAETATRAIAKQNRTLPDSGDLNRSFPGNASGDRAQRLAHSLFREVVARCDFGLDLHAAPNGMESLAHVRGDLENPYVRRLCESFGAHVILDGSGPPRSLRRVCTEFGVPTMTFEAGGSGSSAAQEGIKGIIGVMSDLRMLRGEVPWRGSPTIVRNARWLSASKAGRLEVLVQPGVTLRANDVIARIDGGDPISAPRGALVLSVSASPSVSVGAPVCQVATPVDQNSRGNH